MLLLYLLSTTVFANDILSLHLAKGMKFNSYPSVSSTAQKAQMGCDLYSIHYFDENNVDIKLLTSKKSNVINVGTPTMLTVQYPSPYEALTVSFVHTLASHRDTGFDNFTPYLSALIYTPKTAYAVNALSFTNDSIQSGGSLILRGVYFPNDPDTDDALLYRCSLTVLKE